MARPSPEEIQDMRDAPKLEKAYNKSMRNTPAAPKTKMGYAANFAPETPRGRDKFTPNDDVVISSQPDRKAMRAVSLGADGSESEYEGGGAGRGKVNPTYKKGGSVGSASRRADGIAQRGKTKGRTL